VHDGYLNPSGPIDDRLALLPASCKNFIDRDMADVLKSLYRRYLELSEATFQAFLKNDTADEVHHYKPILNFSSHHKGGEGCLPCHLLQHLR
jgi:hypothetical protein